MDLLAESDDHHLALPSPDRLAAGARPYVRVPGAAHGGPRRALRAADPRAPVLRWGRARLAAAPWIPRGMVLRHARAGLERRSDPHGSRRRAPYVSPFDGR